MFSVSSESQNWWQSLWGCHTTHVYQERLASASACHESICVHTRLISISHCLSLCRQTFQYFGLDFLLDADHHPWLMEVNATPSMKVAHEDQHTQQLIQQQKWEFVQDTFQLLRIQQHMFDEVSTTHLAAQITQGPNVMHSSLVNLLGCL